MDLLKNGDSASIESETKITEIGTDQNNEIDTQVDSEVDAINNELPQSLSNVDERKNREKKPALIRLKT